MKCYTDGCDGTIGERSKTGLCKNCYQSILRYTKQRPRDIIKRARKLKIFSNRLGFVLPQNTVLSSAKTNNKPLEHMPGQVVGIRKRKRKKVA